jgi:hypothetical protein
MRMHSKAREQIAVLGLHGRRIDFLALFVDDDDVAVALSLDIDGDLFGNLVGHYFRMVIILAVDPDWRQFSIVDGPVPDASDAIISIHPGYADAILDGTKTIELRRRVPELANGTRFWIYATRPTAAVVGVATISDVKRAHPARSGRSTGPVLASTTPHSWNTSTVRSKQSRSFWLPSSALVRSRSKNYGKFGTRSIHPKCCCV